MRYKVGDTIVGIYTNSRYEIVDIDAHSEHPYKCKGYPYTMGMRDSEINHSETAKLLGQQICQPSEDPVSTPSHYKRFKYEPIKVIIDWALSPCLANVVKYVARAEHKGKQIQDLKKAQQYLAWEIERLETGDITTGGDK